ncbi:phosphopantetheine-binding protein [Nonomuraea sp. NPDC050153]|uniref:phosphopantetheine-binding protein n=1 Tax=Nonomuraea sp. NPDC050153 TaxID=3364359 RepID=UPI00378D9ADD
MNDVEERILGLLGQIDILLAGPRQQLPQQRLWENGMTSLSSVRLLLLVEEEFDVELPDEALTRTTFESVGSLAAVVRQAAGGSGS